MSEPAKIDIDAMQVAVGESQQRIARIRQGVEDLYELLRSVRLSSPRLNRWRWNGDYLAEVEKVRRELQDRLDQAWAIARTPAGIPSVYMAPGGWRTDYVVTFDEAVNAGPDSRLVADFINRVATDGGWDGQIPADVVAALTAGSGDVGFASLLASQVSAENLALFLSVVNGRRTQLVNDVGLGFRPSSDVEGFDRQYIQLLDGLGAGLSLAARNMSDEDLNRFTQSYASVFADPMVGGTSAPLLLSLVVARGQWPDEFLTGVSQGIATGEGVQGVSHWATPGGDGVVDPGRFLDDGSPVEVSDPMYGIWSAAVYNPQWFLATYQSSDQVQVRFDIVDEATGIMSDGSAMVDGTLNDLIARRGFDHASVGVHDGRVGCGFVAGGHRWGSGGDEPGPGVHGRDPT